MKLASIWFDDQVVIPAGRDVGGALSRQDLRETSFHAVDGWEIDWDPNAKEATVWREGMPTPRPIISGYGSTRLIAVDPEPVVEEPKAKRKR